MKTLTVVLTLIVALLAGSFSSPAMHAMPMADTVSVMSQEVGESHDCCDEAEQATMSASCEQESSFCQHCEQHCAGQIGLTNVFNVIENTSLSQSYTMSELSLWQRTERLIRPPKLTTA
mgnify:CR=1 FL=1